MFALHHRFALIAVATFASFASVACTQSSDEDTSSRSSSTADTQPTEQESDITLGKRKAKKPQACPPVAQPICDAGTELVESKDAATGCTFFECKKKVVCPEIDVPACASTDELVTGTDENGCSYAYCKPAAEPAQ